MTFNEKDKAIGVTMLLYTFFVLTNFGLTWLLNGRLSMDGIHTSLLLWVIYKIYAREFADV